jgi:hypothetical protein
MLSVIPSQPTLSDLCKSVVYCYLSNMLSLTYRVVGLLLLLVLARLANVIF